MFGSSSKNAGLRVQFFKLGSKVKLTRGYVPTFFCVVEAKGHSKIHVGLRFGV